MDFTIVLILLVLLIPFTAGLWKLFEKASQPGWYAIIPFYNLVVLLKIVGRPWSWVFYLIIPVIGQLIAIGVAADLLKSFGKHKTSDLIACVLLPFIYFPYLGFSKNVHYKGPAVNSKGEKSVRQEWTEAIGFAVIAATLIRWLIMEAYTIPTPSMENSLLVGDFLFVSKFHYGTRTTTTPLQVPLTHQKIWFTNWPSYVEWIKLPQYRLPGISHVKREDVVVFNVPPVGLNDGINYPVDLKTNYIKRCVGVAGDTLSIKDQQVYINGVASPVPPEIQFSYLILSDGPISERNLANLGLGTEDYQSHGRQADGKFAYQMWLTKERADEMKALPYIRAIEAQKRTHDEGTIPYSSYYDWAGGPDSTRFVRWSTDNFGPLWIPKKGATITIDKKNLALYGTTIKLYDHNTNVKIDGDQLFIDGQPVTSYTFKQDYFFMMGDNRHNSLDSRFWGFVPEDHIVGKAFFIWLSVDRGSGLSNRIRWNRFFKLIK